MNKLPKQQISLQSALLTAEWPSASGHNNAERRWRRALNVMRAAKFLHNAARVAKMREQDEGQKAHARKLSIASIETDVRN